MGVEGLRFVITGGAAGIGEATAQVAASKGASVVIADITDEAGEAVAAGIRDNGGKAHYVHCDVTSPEDVQNLMEQAANQFGGIDVMHNNAGIHETGIADPANCDLENMSVDTFRKVLEVNATGPWLCSKYALPYLKESELPSIINAGSVGSVSAYPLCIAYGTSKGGIRLQTQNLAVDLAKYGIRVNCYGPTAIATSMVTEFVKQAEDPVAFEKSMTGKGLIPRLGYPEEVAELVCFLASPEAGFINGAYIPIDGGQLAWHGHIDELNL